MYKRWEWEFRNCGINKVRVSKVEGGIYSVSIRYVNMQPDILVTIQDLQHSCLLAGIQTPGPRLPSCLCLLIEKTRRISEGTAQDIKLSALTGCIDFVDERPNLLFGQVGHFLCNTAADV